MEEFNIHEWQSKHLRNKPINKQLSENPEAGGGDYYHKSKNKDVQDIDITFGEFMNNLRNYSSDTDRDEMLTFLTKQIIQDYTDFDLRDLMANLAHEFQRDREGNHFTGEMDVNEDDFPKQYAKAFAKATGNEDDLSDEEIKSKLQQAKRGGGKETSLRKIAALGKKNK